MRFVPELFETIESQRLFGENAPNGRVTVEPAWSLRMTPPAYGNSVRGPFRYYNNGLEVGYEVPSIQSITWNRSKGQDVASCTVTIYNAWHEINEADPEQVQRLGKPGFFWPKRGVGDAATTWNQEPGRGAYRQDGTWEPNFSWSNVLVEDALIKTWEGYGGRPTDGNYISIDDNIENNHVVLTGVWMIDTITAGSNGMMTLTCRDVGRLLLDQIVFPPLIPGGLYPLEYEIAGKSRFESPWGPKVKTGVSPASRGEVRLTAYGSSGSSDSSVSAYTAARAVDADPRTFTLSEAYNSTIGFDPPYTGGNPPAPYFEYTVGQNVTSLKITPWAGGYECYVSVLVGGVWQGTQNIPVDSPRNIRYVQKINIPQYVPDGNEKHVTVNLRDSPNAMYNAQRIRLTFTHLYYSNIPDASGNYYRAGIRDLIAYRVGAKTGGYNSNFAALPWTFSMESHPTRGYWVAESDGTIHGFGDASNFDSTNFGSINIGAYGPNNRIVGIAAHPSGEGYWAVDWMGHVWAHGEADLHGDAPISDPYTAWPNVQTRPQVRDIAATHTGNGYWVCYSNGIIRGFGDASPNYIVIPQTPVLTYMHEWTRQNRQVYVDWNTGLKATSITSHPHAMGLWVTDGNGQVWAYGAAAHHGQLVGRQYRRGYTGSFHLGTDAWVTNIEATATGKGYWVLSGGGLIGAFGDAVNQGPTQIYKPSIAENVVPASVQLDPSFFRALLWGISRDPDGSGFWCLNAAGGVFHHNAEFWGQPGYDGLTGYRWHEGNFNGDWGSIVKELLMWSGFLFRDGNTSLGSTETPSVLGRVEDTGIKTDTHISGDRFDKKTIMDAIKEISEVVAYDFKVSEEGGAVFESSNIWNAGNKDENGQPIYVAGDSLNRVDFDDEDAQPFIPEIHEDINLFEYSASISSTNKRTEYIIGTDAPSPKDASRTGYVRHIPPSALEQVSPGVPAMRGMVRPGIWVSQLFENTEEAQLMAELISLRAWFSQRTGSTSCVGNPLLSLNDQVRIIEQNTSESFIHLINSIDSTMDLDSGTYTMNVSTHWLGDADNWVIVTDSPTGEYPYVRISERLDAWQSRTQRMLNAGSGGFGSNVRSMITGEFNDAIIPTANDASWGIRSVTNGGAGSGDPVGIFNLMMYGNGILWPFDEAGSNVWEDAGISFNNTLNAGLDRGSNELILTLGLAPPLFNLDSPASYIDRAIELINSYQIRKVLVWEDLTDLTMGEYITFFDAVYAAIKSEVSFPVSVYGPNVLIEDAADYDLITDFIDGVTAYDGIAFSGDFSDSEWADVVTDIKALTSAPLVVSLKNGTTGQPNLLHQALSVIDTGLWPSDEPFSNPYNPSSTPNWVFEGTISTNGTLPAFRVTPQVLSAPLGTNSFIEIYQGATLIVNEQLGELHESVLLGNLGSSTESIEYTFRVVGVPTATGNGRLRLAFNANTIQEITVEDNIMIVR